MSIRILAAVLVLLADGCGGGGGKPEAAEPAPVANEATAPAPEDSPASEAIPDHGTGIPGCDLYIEKMLRYLRCERVPPEASDAAMQALEVARSNWRDMRNAGPEAIKAADNSCRQAIVALEQGAPAMGCTI